MQSAAGNLRSINRTKISKLLRRDSSINDARFFYFLPVRSFSDFKRIY